MFIYDIYRILSLPNGENIWKNINLGNKKIQLYEIFLKNSGVYLKEMQTAG